MAKRQKRVARRRPARRFPAAKAQPLTRPQILQRDWTHQSTSDINRKISVLTTQASHRQEEVTRLTADLKEHQKALRIDRSDIEALELLISSRTRS